MKKNLGILGNSSIIGALFTFLAFAMMADFHNVKPFWIIVTFGIITGFFSAIFKWMATPDPN